MQKNISIAVIALVFGLAIGVVSERSLGQHNDKASNIMEGHTMDSTHPVTLAMPDHTHVLQEVDANQPVPTISISAVRDSKSGYNVMINTENFAFSPDQVGKVSKANHGHAHVYVNDKKLMRIYGNWFHLPSEQLPEGTSTLLVTLNTNDHKDWAFKGVGIGAEMILTK